MKHYRNDIISAEREWKLEQSRFDIDEPNVSGQVSGKMKLDPEFSTINGSIEIQVKAINVKARHDFPNVCFFDNCYKISIEPSAGIGVGGTVGFENYKNKAGGSLTGQLGAGLGLMLGIGFSVEHESKKDDNKSINDSDFIKGLDV